MRPLRVLHVMDTVGSGGAEQHLNAVLGELSPERFENHLAWLYEDERLLPEIRPHVVTATPLGSGHGVSHLATVLRLRDLIRKLQVDVVHAQLIRAQVVSRLAAALAGQVPLVSTWQNTYYADESISAFRDSRGQRAFVKSLDALTSRYDSAFVAVSQHVKTDGCKALMVGEERVRVIPNAVHPRRYEPHEAGSLASLRRELGVPAGGHLFVSVGRLVPQKNQERAIEAMQHVRQRFPRAVLVIAGDGPLRDELTRKIEAAGVQEQVKLLGPRRDVSLLLQAADLFVFPSLFEGLPVAMVEALANGVPACVSEIPPNREAGEGVPSIRFVQPDQPVELANMLISMLEDLDSLKALARESAAGVREQFSAARLAAQLGSVFSSVARQ